MNCADGLAPFKRLSQYAENNPLLGILLGAPLLALTFALVFGGMASTFQPWPSWELLFNLLALPGVWPGWWFYRRTLNPKHRPWRKFVGLFFTLVVSYAISFVVVARAIPSALTWLFGDEAIQPYVVMTHTNFHRGKFAGICITGLRIVAAGNYDYLFCANQELFNQVKDGDTLNLKTRTWFIGRWPDTASAATVNIVKK